MKPPPVVHDPRPALWTTGGIFAALGVATMLLDNPLVPITHVFGLVPLALGGAVGAALLRERFGPWANLAYLAFALWLVWQTFAAQTTGGLVFLAVGVYSLTRAFVRTVADD